MSSEAIGRQVFEFIATLIVLSFACRVLLMLIGTPLRMLVIALLMPPALGKLDRAGRWAILVAPELLAVLYSGFITLVTVQFADDTASELRWIYTACGGAVALLSLISYSLGLYAKAETHMFGPRPEDKYWRVTSKISLVAGLAAAVFFYFFPNHILNLPGAAYFFGKVRLLAAWLNGYKVVQVILVVGIAGYFVVTTAMVLFQAMLEAWDWVKVKILSFVRY